MKTGGQIPAIADTRGNQDTAPFILYVFMVRLVSELSLFATPFIALLFILLLDRRPGDLVCNLFARRLAASVSRVAILIPRIIESGQVNLLGVPGQMIPDTPGKRRQILVGHGLYNRGQILVYSSISNNRNLAPYF